VKDAQSESSSDRTVESVARIEHAAYQARSRMDHLAGMITRAAGTGSAIFLHAVWFTVWLLANLRGLPGIQPFDPFPFSLLTTIVSLEAIFLTLFVLVSQNRMSREADRRAQLDLQINVLAEKEATMILRMLQEISRHLVTGPASKDVEDLLKETQLDELAKKLDGALPSE